MINKKSKTKKSVDIYTDGACQGNPGPGGWGAILIYKGHERELSSFCDETTNNRMELTAAIEALKALKEPCCVSLYSDSSYLVDCFEKGWIFNWAKNGWRRNDNNEIKNLDLWNKLYSLYNTHTIVFIKVKGHGNNEYNNRCDKLATRAISAKSADTSVTDI
jgi:ribonuclease HI